ncbi:hypothetical protein [Algivirga pacifica]|uniref:Muconolactone isomerase domain-containing protein n=1 Tax=Algivirga pacifica TaxID=1162670 RepID=A0ABP9DK56_9BACT
MQYIIEAEMPEVLSENLMDLIPDDLEKVQQLMSEQVIYSYSMSADQKRVWVLIEAEDEEEVEDIMRGLEITEHLHYEIHELAFMQQSSSFNIPSFSLN